MAGIIGHGRRRQERRPALPPLPAPQPDSRARRVGPMHYNLSNQTVPLRDGVPAQ